jgi:hypothetical protein
LLPFSLQNYKNKYVEENVWGGESMSGKNLGMLVQGFILLLIIGNPPDNERATK